MSTLTARGLGAFSGSSATVTIRGGAAITENVSSGTWKTTNGLSTASIKTVNGLALASIKTNDGLTP